MCKKAIHLPCLAIDIIPETSSHEEMCTPLIWCEKASLHWPAPSRQAAVLQKHWEEKDGREAPSGCSISGKTARSTQGNIVYIDIALGIPAMDIDGNAGLRGTSGKRDAQLCVAGARDPVRSPILYT